MPNKYSHAQVLFNYREHGMIEFTGSYVVQSRSIVSTFRTADVPHGWSQSRKDLPTQSGPWTTASSSCRCCFSSSRRIRLDSPSPSPPPLSDGGEDIRIPSHVYSNSTQVYVPKGSRAPAFPPTVTDRVTDRAVPQSSPPQIAHPQVSQEASRPRDETNGPVPGSGLDDRGSVGLEGHDAQGLPSIRKLRNRPRRRTSNETEIYAPLALKDDPRGRVRHLEGSVAEFLAKKPPSPPLTPIRHQTLPLSEDIHRGPSPPLIPRRLSSIRIEPDESLPPSPEPMPRRQVDDRASDVSAIHKMEDTAPTASHERPRAISVSTRRSSLNATTLGHTSPAASHVARTRATSISSRPSVAAKSDCTFDLAPDAGTGRPWSVDDGVDFDADLEPLPAEIYSDLDDLCLDMQIPGPERLAARDHQPSEMSKHSFLPNRNEQFSPRPSSVDSAAPPPISLLPQYHLAAKTTAAAGLSTFEHIQKVSQPRNAKRLFPFKFLGNDRQRSHTQAAATTPPTKSMEMHAPPSGPSLLPSSSPSATTPSIKAQASSSTPNLASDPTTPQLASPASAPTPKASSTPHANPMSSFLPRSFTTAATVTNNHTNRPKTPKSIPYASTAPGPAPSSVAVSRTPFPSIPNLFPDTRGHWPPECGPGWVDIGGGEVALIGSAEAEEALSLSQDRYYGRRSRSRAGSSCNSRNSRSCSRKRRSFFGDDYDDDNAAAISSNHDYDYEYVSRNRRGSRSRSRVSSILGRRDSYREQRRDMVSEGVWLDLD